MEKISVEPRKASSERGSQQYQGVRSRFAKNLLNNAGIITGAFIMFSVVVIVTTDITLISPAEITALGLGFFLLLFCSYSMHVSCADSGMRAGLRSDVYIDTVADYDELTEKVSAYQNKNLLYAFCKSYIERELKNTRMVTLLDVGLAYEVYEDLYLGRDKKQIKADKKLTKAQKCAVYKANAIRPIRLTPDMITKRGRGDGRRAPLGLRPVTRKRIHFVWKFIKNVAVAFAMCLIVLDFVTEPTWKVFAVCCMKLLTVAINGFDGYRFGYENIVTDTVNYMNDQMDLMGQALAFGEIVPAEDAEKSTA